VSIDTTSIYAEVDLQRKAEVLAHSSALRSVPSNNKRGNRRERRIVLPLSSLNGKFRITCLRAIVAALTTILSAAPGGSSKVNPRDGLTYQWIPPGSYFTGCLPGDTECYGLERRREKIIVARGFWIARTEVT
jgi:hypothetical protein